MADIMQDVLNLNYSPSFDIQGMQEADIKPQSQPLRSRLRHGLRHRDRRHESPAQRHGQTL